MSISKYLFEKDLFWAEFANGSLANCVIEGIVNQ